MLVDDITGDLFYKTQVYIGKKINSDLCDRIQSRLHLIICKTITYILKQNIEEWKNMVIFNLWLTFKKLTDVMVSRRIMTTTPAIGTN